MPGGASTRLLCPVEPPGCPTTGLPAVGAVEAPAAAGEPPECLSVNPSRFHAGARCAEALSVDDMATVFSRCGCACTAEVRGSACGVWQAGRI